jgi:dTDP-4-dehydrorhamnose reductase
MKILLTGATGQLGHYIQEVAPGHLDASSSLIACGRDIIDLEDPASIHAAIQQHLPDVVINAAGYTAVDRAESEPEIARRVNGEAVKDLLAACHEVGARLIQISTDYVFDGTKREPYLTTDAPNPINVYGETKLLGERMVAGHAEEACIIRSSWIYSEHGQNFANTMRRLFQERKTLKVVNDQFGRPTHARDLARFCLEVAMQAKPSSPIMHYAGPDIMSWHEFAMRLLDEAKPDVVTERIEPVPTSDYPTAAQRPAYTALAIDSPPAANPNSNPTSQA